MRILVTNDDGIDSVGLAVLARRLGDVAEVVVAAPDREYSGFGAALGTLHEMRPEIHRSHIDGVEASWSVTGPPALAVFFARMGVFGPIDLVVAGINPGINVGRAIYHSGTVGAALTARNGGMNGIAVSQAVAGYGVEGQAWDEMLGGLRWETAAEVAATVAAAVIGLQPDPPVVVNVNVPDLPLGDLKGWRYTSVGIVPPRTVTTAELVPKEGYTEVFEVELSWGEPVPLPPDTDGGAVEAGEVSITVLGRMDHEHRDELVGVAPALDAIISP